MKLRMMTFNLRYDKPDTGENSWPIRRESVFELIDHYRPPIICTQECLPNQLLDLHRFLPDYQSLGRDRDGTGKGEHCAIFYLKSLLSHLKSGDFWLSDTPEVPGSKSVGWENPDPRIMSWVRFYLRRKQVSLTVFNTHLDFYSERARILGTQLISKYVSTLKPEDSYIIVAGDFNSHPNTEVRETFLKPMKNGLTLIDSVNSLPFEQQKTFHRGFTGKATDPVDTIYIDSRLKLISAEVNRDKWRGIWPSDHFPVILSFEFPSIDIASATSQFLLEAHSP